MKRLAAAVVLLVLCISFPASLTAGNMENEGKGWLDAQKDPPAMNVNGIWDSDEWGVFHLTQAEGSREVSGSGGGYGITGVVSGKRLFMLFTTDRTVEYCATLSSDSDHSLAGSYSSRKSRLKRGLCQEKTRPMYMTKK